VWRRHRLGVTKVSAGIDTLRAGNCLNQVRYLGFTHLVSAQDRPTVSGRWWFYDVMNLLAGGGPMTTEAGPQTVPSWDISPGAYGALSEALAVIYWNKNALHPFLRDHSELLAGYRFHWAEA
jgi:hypothetical protein